AELVDSTVGGVKAALNRGRSKLADGSAKTPPPRMPSDQDAAILRLYVQRFNERDWSGLRELIAADARLTVADRFVGPLSDSSYFSNYERMPVTWRVVAGEVDGEAVIIFQQTADGAISRSTPVRLQVVDGRIAGIRDYWHCPWILSVATTIVEEPAWAEPIARVSFDGRRP